MTASEIILLIPLLYHVKLKENFDSVSTRFLSLGAAIILTPQHTVLTDKSQNRNLTFCYCFNNIEEVFHSGNLKKASLAFSLLRYE